MSEEQAETPPKTIEPANAVPTDILVSVSLDDSGQKAGQEHKAITEPVRPLPVGLKPWVKGQSGNLKGRPKEVMNREQILQEVRKYGEEAVDKVVELMRGEDPRTAGKMALSLLQIGHDLGPKPSGGTTVNVNTGTQSFDGWTDPHFALYELFEKHIASKRTARSVTELLEQLLADSGVVTVEVAKP